MTEMVLVTACLRNRWEARFHCRWERFSYPRGKHRARSTRYGCLTTGLARGYLGDRRGRRCGSSGEPTAPAVAHQTSTRTKTIARRRRQRWTAHLVTALLLVAAGSLVSPPASHAAGPKLTAMTRNLYLGTALDNVTAASNFAEFVQAVSQD